MNKHYLFLKGCILSFLFFCTANQIQAATVTAAASGLWNAPTTWVGVAVPMPGDDVIIPANFTVTVSTNQTCKSLTLNGATAAAGVGVTVNLGVTLTITLDLLVNGGTTAAQKTIFLNNGTTSVGGNVLITSGTTSSTFAASNGRVANGGTMSVTGNFTLEFSTVGGVVLDMQGGTLNVAGNFTSGTGSTGYGFVNYTGNGIINITGGNSNANIGAYLALTMGATTSEFNLTGATSTFTCNTTGSAFNMGTGASIARFNGNVNVGATFNPNGTTSTSKVFFTSSAPQTIPAANYYDLISSNGGDRILATTGTVGIAGAFTKGTSLFTTTGSTVNYNGTGAQTVVVLDYNNLTISGAHTTNNVTIDNTGIIGVAGVFVNSATFTLTGAIVATGSTINYNGNAAQTIIAFPYNNLNITKPTTIVASTSLGAADIHVNGNCTVFSGILAVSTGGTVAGQLAEYTFTGNNISSILEVKDGATFRLIGTSSFPASFPTSWSSIILNPNSNTDYASVQVIFPQTIVSRQYGNLLNSSAGGARILASSGIIKLAGSFSPNTPTVTYTITGSTIEYNGTTAQTIAPFNYNNLSVTNTGTNMTLAGVAGVAGIFTPNAISFGTNTGTIDYNGSIGQTIIAFSYFNLTSSSTGARTFPSSGIVKVAGTLATGSTNTFTLTGSTVEFNGAGAQSLTGDVGNAANPFVNLTINNSGALPNGLTLSGSVTVSSVLNMANGHLILNGNTLIISNPATTAVTRTAGVIISENTSNLSKMQWNIGTTTGAHVFPFGKSVTTYIPFTLDLTSGDATNIIVSTYPTAADNTPLPTTPQTVTGIDGQGATDAANRVVDRFWQIDASAAIARTATLTFSYAATEIPFTIPKAQRWNSSTSTWDPAISGQTYTATSVTVAGVTTFSPWAVYNAAVILPLASLKFSAIPVNNKFIKLNWNTENEININNYTIEKAVAGSSNFAAIGTVSSQRNATANTYGFEDTDVRENITYQYRLRIAENNRNTYSEIKLASIKGKNFQLKIAPNPSTGNFKINVEGFKGTTGITVYNQAGQAVINRTENLDYGVPVIVDLRNFSKGIYTLRMRMNDQMIATKLIVE